MTIDLSQYERPNLPLPTRRWLTPDEACSYYAVKSPTTLKAMFKRIGYRMNRLFGPNSPRVDIVEVDRLLVEAWQAEQQQAGGDQGDE
jgi:hypothetical protein